MPSEAPAPTLPCSQCNYVNEPERVYCHNCGAKLDRSVLPKEEQIRRESPDKARKRIQRMTNPKANVALREAKAFAQVMIWSILVAVIIQAVRPPDGLPSVQKNALPRLISSDISDALEAPQPRTITLTEPEINTYLKSSIHEAKDANFLASVIEFERAYVHLTPGVCNIGMEKNLWGLPLFFSTAYKLDVVNGAFVATNIGGSFGRLPIHPALMSGFSYAFQGLWNAFHRDQENMKKMQSVIVEQGRITLVTKGAGKH